MPLPPGLLLNPQTGEVTGVPTQTGTFDVQLRVRDTLGNQTLVEDQITIEPYTPMEFTNGYLPMMRTRAYSDGPVVTGGKLPITFAIVGGALPAGLSFNTSTGVVSGTPSAVQAYSFTVRATDAIAQTKDLVVTGNVVENITASFVAGALATVGVAYATGVPTRAGGTAPFVWNVQAGTLPPGLTLDPATGIISGTPTTAGSYSGIALRVTDANGFQVTTATQAITVALAPTLSGSLGRGTATRAWAGGSYARADGHAAFVWGATGLPPGLSINTSTGAITGTPTTPGTYNPIVTVTDAAGNVATRSNAVTIAANLAISGTVPNGTRNIPYTFTPTVVGGWSAYAYAISAGALPAGLSLNASTGVISGTPTTQAPYTATLRVTDADGNQATMAVNIDVGGDLQLTGSTPNRGTTTLAYSGTTYAASGGLAPYVWSISAGALPAGLSLNSATGAITGTPTAPGNYNFTVRVTDANNSFVQAAASIAVAAYPTLSGTLIDASNGIAYDQGLSASGGHAPLVWDISAGALPTGLSINSGTGRITGTPTVNGASSFTVRVTDNAGNVVTSAQTITVYAQPSLSGTLTSEGESALANGTDGTAYNSGLTAGGGKPNLSWSVSGTLPPGLSINASTGVISGNIGVVNSGGAGFTDYAFDVRATDALGRVATSSQSIRVYWRLANTTGTLPAATNTVAYSRNLTTQYGKAPVTWANVGGALPTGLSLSSGGLLSGTPTVDGTFALTLRATDALGKTVDHSQNLTIYPVAALSGDAPRGTTSVGYGYTYGRSGGDGTYSWSIVAGALPGGLSLNSSGQIVGTPNAAGTFNFTVRVTSAGDTADLADQIVIAAYPNLSALNYPRGTVGRAYSGTVTSSGGHAPVTYSVAAGALPPGLTLNASTGAVSGTPNTNGNFGFYIRMTDNAGNISDRYGEIAIATAVVINNSFATPATQGQTYVSTVTASGGWVGYNFTIVAGAVPPGLSMGNGGTLSGNPTTPGNYGFTVRATDVDGNIADRYMEVLINAATPALSISASPNPSSSTAYSQGQSVTATAATTATASGGTGNYTYSSQKISDVVDLGQGSATATQYNNGRSVSITKSGKNDYSNTQQWRFTVTDGVSSAYVDVPLSVAIWSNV